MPLVYILIYLILTTYYLVYGNKRYDVSTFFTSHPLSTVIFISRLVLPESSDTSIRTTYYINKYQLLTPLFVCLHPYTYVYICVYYLLLIT